MRPWVLPSRRRGLPWTAALLTAVLGTVLWSPHTAAGEPLPDVVVAGLTLAPASARAGDTVTATVTVRNQGSGPADASLVGLYFGISSGSPLTSAVPLGTITVDGLVPGASQQLSKSFTVPDVAPGSFTVIAAADGAAALIENNETNNKRTATLRVTIADLTVSRVTLVPSYARTGDTVTATAVVYNAGQVPAAAGIVRLHFETASGVAPTVLGSLSAGPLAAGESREVSFAFTVPSVPSGRSYYVWALVDPDGSLLETNEGNNRRGTWLQVTIPDLTITSLSVRPAPARAGDPVSAIVVVRNSGRVPADPSFLRLYFETASGTPPSPPTLLGTATVPILGPGESRELSLPFTVPAVPYGRSYYVWALVDPDGSLLETNEGNNRRGTWLQVTIPDLTITSLSVRPAPARAGDPVSAVVVVRNSGRVPADPSFLRLYFETASGTPPSPPTLLGTATVPILGPGESRELSLPFTVPAVPYGRSYYVWALVDPDGSLLETNEGNNRRGAWLSVSVPDLTVSGLSLTPTPTRAGDPISVTLRVRNQGPVPANASRASLYITTASNAPLDGLAPVATVDVPVLAAGKEAQLVQSVTPSVLAAGYYNLVAVADSGATVIEGSETNNRRTAGFEVAVPAVTVDTLGVTPSLVYPGQAATASVRLVNRGRAWSRPTTADVFLATSELADLAEGAAVQTIAVNSLGPGASVSFVVPVPVPLVDPGAHYVIAEVDASTAVGGWTTMVASVASTGSPSRPRKAVKLHVSQSDLTTEALAVSPTQARPGQNVTVTFTVRNAGSVAAPASTADVYLASQANTTLSEATRLKTVSVPSLAAGTSVRVTLAVSVPTTEAGQFYIVVAADAGATLVESVETNNRAAVGLQLLGNSSDLTVWVVDNLTRIQPTDSPGSLAGASIKAARNEYEAFQIVIRAPDNSSLSNVNVVASDLIGPGGASAGQVRLYREHYVRVTTPSPHSPYPPGWWPDALIPFVHPDTGQPLGGRFRAAPFPVSAGRNQPVWAEVRVSQSAPPGTYQAELTVTADGHFPAVVPVTLTVWNFTLPTRPSLQTWFGGVDVGDPVVAERYLDELLRHGVSPMSPDRTNPRVRQDGSIDTTASDAALADFLKRASTWTIPWWPGGYPFPDPLGADRTRTQRYFHDVQEYLRARGWLKRAVLYLYDEPDNPDKMLWAQEYARLVRSAAPDLRILVTTPIEPPLEGLVNLWVPLFRQQDPALTQDRQARGEEVWSYTAIAVDPAYPIWQLDFPLLHYRIPGWLNWADRLTGLLYWANNYWMESSDPWTDPTTYGPLNLDGALVYPGNAIGYDGPVASMRLKAIRDAIEDYEYLLILTSLGDRASASSIASTVGTFAQWTRNPTDIQEARERLGDRINQLAR